MKKIEADLDRYGKEARASCLADYIETLALHSRTCTYDQLADLIADRWDMKRQIFLLPDEDEDETAEAYADSTWLCLRERAEMLGGLYPFEVDDLRVRLSTGFNIRASAYVALLCITLLHAYDLPSPYDVEETFEDVVADSLVELGMTVGRFGAINRSNGFDFVASVRQLSEVMRIPMSVRSASRRASANDSGLDVIGHLDWADGRSGRWIFLGQVTCGGSERWGAKLADVKVGRWTRFISEFIQPIKFLAIPHHADRRAFQYFVEGEQHMLVDRPRLALHLGRPSAELVALIDALLDVSVEGVEVQV